MKKILQFSLLILIVLISVDADLYGQRSKKKKKKSETDEYFDESGGFAHRLWYGAGAIVGFSGSNGVNVFTIGVTPMVGYKIIEPFSIGPKASIQYSAIKVNNGGGSASSANPVSWSVGVFSRYKVFRFIFAQVEYEFENDAEIFYDGRNLGISRRENNNVYIGGGYNSGEGEVGFELVLLYNLNVPASSFDLPFEFRGGLTYKF